MSHSAMSHVLQVVAMSFGLDEMIIAEDMTNISITERLVLMGQRMLTFETAMGSIASLSALVTNCENRVPSYSDVAYKSPPSKIPSTPPYQQSMIRQIH